MSAVVRVRRQASPAQPGSSRSGVTWTLLLCAVASEVCASFSLRMALDERAYYVVVVTGYSLSFYFLGAVLRRGMPLGVAYGLWAALGVALTVALSTLLLDEALTPWMVVGLVLIIIGVLLVELGSRGSNGL